MKPPKYIASEEETELLNMCKAGKLYEIEQWAAAGYSLNVSPKCKKLPLQIAVEWGFHSLVVFLARRKPDARGRNGAMEAAVAKKRLDLVKVLVENGAYINAVPFGGRPIYLGS